MTKNSVDDGYYRSYSILSPDNIHGFDPFNPDPVGALREAYVYITQGGQGHPPSTYNRLVMMMSRALAKADGRPMPSVSAQ